MQVTIRKATAVDTDALANFRAGLSGDVGAGRTADPAADHADFRELFSTWLGQHQSTHMPFVVDMDGVIAGMAWMMVAERVPSRDRRDRRFGDVQSVYVVPEMRNSGVGAALLNHVLDEARQ